MALAADLRQDLRPEESAAASSETAESTTTTVVVGEVNQVDGNRQEKNRPLPPLLVGQ